MKNGKRFHANGNENKTGVAILISDKTDFKTKFSLFKSKKDKRHYIKGLIQQEDTIVNMHPTQEHLST